MSALDLKIPPVAQLILNAAAMWTVSRSIPSLSVTIPGHLVLAFILMATGLAIVVAGVLAFRRAQTTINPLKPEEAASVVSTGIYRWTRNPMYLGLLMMLAGWAFLLEHPLAFAFLPVFVGYMTRFQIYPEERAMRSGFDDEYREYMDSVRRWI